MRKPQDNFPTITPVRTYATTLHGCIVTVKVYHPIPAPRGFTAKPRMWIPLPTVNLSTYLG